MQAPRCQKCGGWLESSKDRSFWICKECGSEYKYEESPPTNEMILLQRMSDELKECASQIISVSQRFEGVLAHLDSFTSELPSVPQSLCEVGELSKMYQSGCKLQQDAIESSNKLIDALQSWSF